MTRTDLVPAPLDDVAVVTTADLRRALDQQIAVTAHHVARLATIWRELERRGEDLAEYRAGIGQYLSAVASGRLLPDAVVRLAGNRPALRAMALLSSDEQKRILDAGHVRVLRADVATDVPIHRLTSGDISRAFDTVNGRVIPAGDQRAQQKRAPRTQRADRRIVLMLTTPQYDALQAAARRTNRSASALALQILTDDGVFK